MTEGMGSDFSEVGKLFDSYEQFHLGFEEFCHTNYQPFIITTNNKRQITLHCRHGYRRSSECTGQRTKLHYNYLGCGAKITCYKPAKSDRVRITSVNLDHCHEISKVAFESTHLNEQEEELLTDLQEANCKVSEISRAFRRKFDQNLSSRKIRNLIQKLAPSSTEDSSSQLQTFLEELDERGGGDTCIVKLIQMEMCLFCLCPLVS